jgi:hypothetical protein
MPKTAKEVDLFWKRLEAERHDQTWLHPVARKADPAPEQAKLDNRIRDNVMFHAGRYYEGARDPKAVRAHLNAQKIIDREKNGK